MRPIVWICVAVFAVVMEFVAFGAKAIVNSYGAAGAIVTIAAMYGAARLYERRRR